MSFDPFLLHHETEVLLVVDAAQLFAHLDDHRRLSSHMEKPSLMTAGASMRMETDERHGQAVGSVIRLKGTVLGLHLFVEEAVTRREPPYQKSWETIGEPRLLVIGAYRMGFAIAPMETGSRLVVSIDYKLPSHGITRVLGWLLGRAYAAWCTRQMADDAGAAFGEPNRHNGRILMQGGYDTRRLRASRWLMTACGIWLIGLGAYFVVLRPALLPEDARFMGTTLSHLLEAAPGLLGWLRIVFIVMGGYMVGTGALTLYVARVAMPGRLVGTIGALAFAGLSTVVLMSAMNFVLHSDFRWVLLVPVVVWFAGLACFALEELGTSRG